MTSSEWHREDVRGHEVACLVVESVECDVTLIRVQAARGAGRKTSLRVTSPVAALVPKSMLSLRPRPNFRGWKKFERILRKRPGWSPQLKLKYHLGKHTGFPPAAAHPRHTCHLFLPVTFRPCASGHPRMFPQPAVVCYIRAIHTVNGLIWLHCMEWRIIHKQHIQRLTL